MTLIRPDELGQGNEPATGGDRPRLRPDISGHHPEQGGLARTVRPDQSCGESLADAEAHVVEQRSPVGQDMADVRHLDVPPGAHHRTIATTPPPRQRDYVRVEAE